MLTRHIIPQWHHGTLQADYMTMNLTVHTMVQTFFPDGEGECFRMTMLLCTLLGALALGA